MDFEAILSERTALAEKVLKEYALLKEEDYQKTVIEAMNYSVMAGGKRLRPVFMYECYRMCQGDDEIVYPFMAAIEQIHTYSLVHDDLPAMDNDEYRRGRRTTHIEYGEDMAILAGDALLNHAFETAMEAFDIAGPDPELCERIVRALRVLAKCAGIYGMIGGQTADVEAEDKQLEMDESRILFIFKYKTAALIEAAMMIGAILADAPHEDVKIIEEAARNIGIAFQIQDDILDVIGNAEELGKPIGSDAKNNKITYVTLKGMDTAKADVEKYTNEAIRLIESLDYDTEFLKELFLSLVNRTK